MAKKKKVPTLRLDSAHNVHGVLDHMLAETVVHQRHSAKRLSIPYKLAVEKPDPKFADSLLVIEIITYWDVKRSEHDDGESNPERDKSSPIKTRH